MFRNTISVHVQAQFMYAGIVPYANFCAPAVMPTWKLTRKAYEERQDFFKQAKQLGYDADLVLCDHPGDPQKQNDNPECWDWAVPFWGAPKLYAEQAS